MTSHSLRASNAWRSRLRALHIAAASVVALACAIPISYYDATTYRALTDLKVDVTQLVASFDSLAVAENAGEIAATRTRLLKAHEYEKGKGAHNRDTATQLELLIQLYDRVVARYQASGPDPALRDFQQLSEQLSQAFDTAIATESAKNRDKQ